MPLRTLTLNPGESGVIKKNVKIIAVVTTGDTVASSSCSNLPDPVGTACWNYEYSGRISNTSSSYFSANMWSYMFGGVEYPLPTVVQTFDVTNSYFGQGGNPSLATIASQTYDALKKAGVIAVQANGCIDTTGQTSVASILQLKLPEGVTPGHIRLKTSNSLGEDQFYLIEPYLSDDCSLPCDA